jgi:tripartite-type tricarboxylate transporter receptor subunit TctC
VRHWLLGFVLALSCIGHAAADDYPSRPIILVIPLSVGGSTDVIGRLVAEGMRKALNQTIVVENTSGAGGTIGVGRVVHASPDG